MTKKWLDRYGKSFPFYRGFTSAKESPDDPFTVKSPHDRYSLHTNICGTCSKMYRNLKKGSSALLALAAVSGTLGIATAGSWMSIMFATVTFLALTGIVGLRWMRARFS